MTEEEFYKKKIFDKIGINQLKQEFPELVDSIQTWFKSEQYKNIQNKKTQLTNKLKQMSEDGDDIILNNDQLYNLYRWFEIGRAHV